MSTSSVVLIDEPRTRRPSKYLAFVVSVIVFLSISAVFIALYFKEKARNSHPPSEHSQHTNSKCGLCDSPTCVMSAAGIV
jgi:hypothetical protein